jgi:uncharacterized membrane protein
MKQLLALAPFALLTACYGAPPPAPPITPNPPGGVYSAAGTEPFWTLTVDSQQMVFTDRNTNAQIIQPTPSAIVGAGGETYQTPRIRLNIVHTPCNNGMSDRNYPDRVQVTVDGRSFSGCGGAGSP